ncbi:MAG TPA: hypothetical protein VFE67_02880 [Rudaea sp.]|nr:hypothetical protein [Rudaea sp.]
MSASRITCAMAAIVLCAQAAHADLLIGDFRETNGVGPVLRYDDTAEGAAAPSGTFYTNLNGGGDVLHSAASMTFEPLENVIYAADFYGQAIRVYPSAASGNAAALRTLNPSQLGQPIQIAISVAHEELIAVTSNGVEIYLRSASGSSAYPQRTLPLSITTAGSRTRLNNPGGIVLRPAGDEIAVPDYGTGAGGYFGVVLFFSRGVTGNTAPSRTLEGPQTLLGIAAFGISYDKTHDEILVLSQDSSQYPYVYRISAFAGSASGNTAPLRSISGANTLLGNVHAISYDDSTEVLYVSEGGENGVPARILVFARGANGDVAPDRVIVPNGASFVLPQGITSVYDELFKNGFD